MFKLFKRSVVLFTVFALALSLVAPLALVPQAAASSDNKIDRVLNLDTDADDTVNDGIYRTPKLTLTDDEDDWDVEETFRVVISSGGEWGALDDTEYLEKDVDDVWYYLDDGTYSDDEPDAEDEIYSAITKLSKTSLEVTFYNANDGDSDIDQKMYIPMAVEFDSPEKGEQKVTIDPRESAVSSGSYTFVVMADGGTVTTIDDTKSFARSTTLEQIQIDETYVDALADTDQELTLKLPPKFRWYVNSDDEFVGEDDDNVAIDEALSGKDAAVSDFEADGRTLKYIFDAEETGKRDSLFLDGLSIIADRDAPTGDVVVEVSGDNVDDADLTVATYGDYNVEVTVDEVTEVVAGRGWDDYNLSGIITIEETAPGSMIADRDIMITLPPEVKPVVPDLDPDMDDEDTYQIEVNGLYPYIDDFDEDNLPDIDEDTFLVWEKDANELYIDGNQITALADRDDPNDTAYIEFSLYLSVQADFTGDIAATFKGAGIGGCDESVVTIAKAIAPVTIEGDKVDLKIGKQDQPMPNLTITENIKEAIDPDDEALTEDAETLCVSLNDDYDADNGDSIVWADTPTVKVIEGNGEVDEDNIEVDNQFLYIPFDSSSTKPMKIEISDILVTVDRTAAEGWYALAVGGGALVKNYDGEAKKTTAPGFDTWGVTSTDWLNIITPAPGEVIAKSMFTIDSTTYKVVENGKEVEKTLDAAPYVTNGRTMLPLRAVATALGVADNQVQWNASNRTALVNRAGKLAQVTVGSAVLDVNGMKITMDAPAELKNGRVFIPVAQLATALGVNYSWDAATKTVTFEASISDVN